MAIILCNAIVTLGGVGWSEMKKSEQLLIIQGQPLPTIKYKNNAWKTEEL